MGTYDWQMHFNPDKCFVVRLLHARNIKQFNYTLGKTTLQETDSHSIIPRNMHNHRLKLEQTYTSDNSLSKPHPSIHQTHAISTHAPHQHQNNSLHNPSPTTFRILIFSMGPPHPDPNQSNRNGSKTRSPFLS